jgi:hypothetical protein
MVLAIRDAYLQGDFTSIPNGTVMAGELTKAPPQPHVPGTPAHQQQHFNQSPTAQTTPEPTSAPTTGTGGTHTTTSGGTTTGGGSGGSGGGGTQSGGGGGGVHVGGTTVAPLPSTPATPVNQALTLAQATAQCTLDGLNQLLQPQAFQDCLNHYMNP